jgi:restriction endonuclease S subunit
MKLENIAEIRPGYSFRTSLMEDFGGNVAVLQARNVQNDFEITAENLVKIDFPEPKSSSFIQKNDILLVARGVGPGSFRAAIFSSDEQNILAASSVVIIRPKTDHANKILPEYITLYLNSSDGQRLLMQTIHGSNIQTISHTELRKLDISIPPLVTQKSLVELSRNIRLQEQIMQKKSMLGKDIIKGIFTELRTA